MYLEGPIEDADRLAKCAKEHIDEVDWPHGVLSVDTNGYPQAQACGCFSGLWLCMVPEVVQF